MGNEELSAVQSQQLVGLLNEQKEQLQQQLESSEADVKPVTLDQQSVGRVSRIDAIQQQQMAIASQEQARNLLIATNNSLTRFDNGEYGYCLECGDPIGFARLQVQPQAEFCVACQQKMEQF